MPPITPLPQFLEQRFAHWRAAELPRQHAKYAHLATHGQQPPAMVISCCDSRVLATSLFGGEVGDFFMHRNIANFVPAKDQNAAAYGTAAAVEYAVTALKVSHLIVMGHASCGGVRGCHDMCQGDAPALERADSYVGQWVKMIRPAYEKVKQIKDTQTRITRMEHEAVLLSLANLIGYDFVKSAVENGALTLHGLWFDIASGALEQYDPARAEFVKV